MPFYVQYNEIGKITGTIYTANAPVHPRQLCFDSFVELGGKRVNIETRQLEDFVEEIIPVEEPVV